MKVVLTITGSQRFGTDEPEKTSLVTEGTLEREGDILLLSYEESELTGMDCLLYTSGSRHARPDIGQTGQLQQALNGAVLAVFAVQDRENDVDALTHNAVALKIQQALPAHRRDRRAAVLRAMLPLARRQLAVVPAAVQDPFAGQMCIIDSFTPVEFPAQFDGAVVRGILEKFLQTYDPADDAAVWFDKVKACLLYTSRCV